MREKGNWVESRNSILPTFLLSAFNLLQPIYFSSVAFVSCEEIKNKLLGIKILCTVFKKIINRQLSVRIRLSK